MAQDEITLRTAIETGAGAIALASLAVLGLALIAEIVRRRHANAAIVVLADRFLPSGGRRCAVAVLAVLSGYTAVMGAGPASADPSVRGWLTAPPATTTSPPPSSVAEPAIAEPELLAPTVAAEPPPTTNGPAISVPMAPRVATVVGSPARVPETGPASVDPRIDPRPVPGPMDSPPPAVKAWPQPRPTRPLAPPPTPPPTPVPAPTVAPLPTYVVQPGDCLWAIAARGLPAGATNIEIDHAWRALYAANQAGIGDNPSLIHPGLVLTLAQVHATSTSPDL